MARATPAVMLVRETRRQHDASHARTLSERGVLQLSQSPKYLRFLGLSPPPRAIHGPMRVLPFQNPSRNQNFTPCILSRVLKQ